MKLCCLEFFHPKGGSGNTFVDIPLLGQVLVKGVVDSVGTGGSIVVELDGMVEGAEFADGNFAVSNLLVPRVFDNEGDFAQLGETPLTLFPVSQGTLKMNLLTWAVKTALAIDFGGEVVLGGRPADGNVELPGVHRTEPAVLNVDFILTLLEQEIELGGIVVGGLFPGEVRPTRGLDESLLVAGTSPQRPSSVIEHGGFHTVLRNGLIET